MFLLKKILAVQIAYFVLSVQALPQKTCVSVMGKEAYKNILPVGDRTPQVRDAILKQFQERYAPIIVDPTKADLYLRHIKVLDLDYKGITSLKDGDFSGLTSLEELYLDYNKLSDLPPGFLSGVTSLKKLDLRYNKLSDLPLGFLSGLTSLEELYLNNNKLSDLPPGFLSGVSLKKLRLDNNN